MTTFMLGGRRGPGVEAKVPTCESCADAVSDTVDGNAKRWAWLHADLGRGDVCEVVAATSTRRGLSVLPPLPFVRLRVAGGEWPPGDPLIGALRMSAHTSICRRGPCAVDARTG